MAIKLSDKSLEDLEKESKTSEYKPIPAGEICDFEVLREGKAYGKTKFTEETISSTNKPMLIAVLEVFYEAKSRIIVIYLTEGDSNYEQWKNKSFAACLGIKELSAAQAVGKTGRLIVDIEVSEDGKYTNNIAKEFLPQAVEVVLDDGIPY